MSTIELKWRDRIIGHAQTPRKFLDFVIDGKSLYEQLGDLVTPFVWSSPGESQKAINRLRLIEEADFPNNRRSIYVCPECGDLGCGAVSAVIERIGKTIIWREFGYQNNYDDFVNLEDLEDLGPFVFGEQEYQNVLRSITNQKCL